MIDTDVRNYVRNIQYTTCMTKLNTLYKQLSFEIHYFSDLTISTDIP